MCGISKTMPVMATRRCQIAALSMPSNATSTQGRVLIRISPTDQQQDRLGSQDWPKVRGARLPGRHRREPERCRSRRPGR